MGVGTVGQGIFKAGGVTILDGALGTVLQAGGLAPGARPEALCLSEPDRVRAVHAAYLAAGADILYANTFGANNKKFAGSGLSVTECITAAVRLAGEARRDSGRAGVKIALDVGPLGEMLAPGGTVSFAEAYDDFAEVMRAGEAAGADLVAIETMTDLYEAKAALLAAKECTALPVMLSMSFEENGRSFTGVPVEAMTATLEPLGAAALGINCSLGPAGMLPLLRRLCAATSLPVFAKPNAGLPDPLTGGYSLSPAQFCKEIARCVDLGVAAVGGCCGTTPEVIRLLAQTLRDKAPAARSHAPRSVVCSGTRVVEIDDVRPIGERINPTGKPRLQQALAAGDMAYIQALAVAQAAAGAAILDVNVGAPGVDEVALLPRAVQAVQAVCDLPLQLDSANPAALEAALRVYNGKPIVNSTSGEAEKMARVLPLCRRYGAAVVGLTLDEDGIPATAAGRLAVAQKILAAAEAAGLPKEDVYIDCLTLAASAGQGAADEALQAVRLVKEALGLKTVLGVSNVSFGLPARPLVNRTFLAMALAAGLDLPILNPDAEGMLDTVAAFRMLHGADPGAEAFLARFGGGDSAVSAAGNGGNPSAANGMGGQASANNSPQEGKQPGGEPLSLEAAIQAGLKDAAAQAARQLLADGNEGLAVVTGHMMPALDRVGLGFEAGTVFLPQLLAAAAAAQAAFEVIRTVYGTDAQNGPPVVVATVKGDVHDIGKNIARVLLENYGFQVTDLGRDVPPDRVVRAAQDTGAQLVGLSALMTTTLPAMAETVAALHAALPDCRVMVGGAVLTAEYAQSIGAAYYVKDAKASVDAARQVYGI